MVFTVRCFKCGESAVRLVLGGRAILHARCHACGANLLSEVLEFEQHVISRAPLNGTTEAEERAVEELADPPTGELDPDDLPADLAPDALHVGEMA